ncbi:MAG: type II toxin-antitoxin system HicA family toxin [Candidatus Omnitrophica bacterium]|nr:type II toxin-antitoxin system HicA family toxin [Candidatus Omnitrophota bacterium]
MGHRHARLGVAPHAAAVAKGPFFPEDGEERRELIEHLEANGYNLLREGANHSTYANQVKTIPVKRHRTLDRITANEICKQAGLKTRF